MFVLMLEFFKVGLFAVGGGLATFPFLMDLTTKYNWFSQKELLDMIAVSESTPGAIGINTATFAGFKAFGFMGGIVATLSLILPAFIIIIVISHMLNKFKNSITVKNIFAAIRPSTAGLILAAMSSVIVLSLFDVETFRKSGEFLSLFRTIPIILFVAVFVLLRKVKNIHPVIIILLGAVCGILLNL